MYCIDIRKVAIHIYYMLNSLRKTAVLVNVHYSTISRWLKNIEVKKYNRKSITKTEKIVNIIKNTVTCNPLANCRQLKELISSTLSIVVSKELIRTILRNNNFTKKKARFYGEPKNLNEKINIFLAKREIFKTQNKTFVSVDETSFNRNNTSIYGYSLKGNKIFIRKNVPRITSKTAICCISDNKIILNQIIEGSINKNIFLNFIESLNLSSNHVLLLDNASIHHSKLIKNYCMSKNIELLYTPPYSPWFNPIELAFSIVKRSYYKCQDISRAFNSLNKDHLKSFFIKSLSTTTKF